ncbi:MAG: hypothetical protein R3A45_11525 [Bdellovibrionota bacterium]
MKKIFVSLLLISGNVLAYNPLLDSVNQHNFITGTEGRKVLFKHIQMFDNIISIERNVSDLQYIVNSERGCKLIVELARKEMPEGFMGVAPIESMMVIESSGECKE